MKKFVVVLFTVFVLSEAELSMPNYMGTCRRDDPRINECFARKANAAMKYIAQGDPAYNIQSLLPFVFAGPLTVDLSPVKLTLRDMIFTGLENVTVSNADIDFKDQKIKFTYSSPLIIWAGKYKIYVKINGRDQENEGRVKIYYRNGHYVATFGYKLRNINGKDYAQITKASDNFLRHDPEFYFDNLDPNCAVRDAWDKVENDFINDQIENACADIVADFVNGILTAVPYDVVFPK